MSWKGKKEKKKRRTKWREEGNIKERNKESKANKYSKKKVT